MNCLTCRGTFGTPQHWYVSKHLRDPLYLCETCAERWRDYYAYTDLRLQDSPGSGRNQPPPPPASWSASESANN